ncbi:hypothetical protein [Alteromonas macleodii]
MLKILSLLLVLLLIACNSTPSVKPKVEIGYSKNTNTASVKVISKSD